MPDRPDNLFFERTLLCWGYWQGKIHYAIVYCQDGLSRKVCSLSVLGTSAFPPLRTRRRVVAWSMPGTSKPVASWEGAHTDVTFRWGYPWWRRHQILLTHLGSRSRGRSPAWSGVAWLFWWYYCEGMEAALTRAHLHSTFSRGVGGWFFFGHFGPRGKPWQHSFSSFSGSCGSCCKLTFSSFPTVLLRS
jgi:hypothetical protein